MRTMFGLAESLAPTAIELAAKDENTQIAKATKFKEFGNDIFRDWGMDREITQTAPVEEGF